MGTTGQTTDPQKRHNLRFVFVLVGNVWCRTQLLENVTNSQVGSLGSIMS